MRPTDLDPAFISHAPGYWSNEDTSGQWNDHRWQLRNRVDSLADLEARLNLTDVERAGVLLAGTKLAMAITPHFFNLIDPNDPDCPIRRQVIPRIEEGWTAPEELADPCGEDSDMPVH
jgi:lysine 2,3-aminomutase